MKILTVEQAQKLNYMIVQGKHPIAHKGSETRRCFTNLEAILVDYLRDALDIINHYQNGQTPAQEYEDVCACINLRAHLEAIDTGTPEPVTKADEFLALLGRR